MITKIAPAALSIRSSAVLLVCHCAGMLDLVALPLWMGALIGRLQLDPQRAGALVTLFLVGQVLASLVCAPRFQRLPRRLVATLGFTVAAAAFAALTSPQDYAVMALLHFIGGVGAGSALSVTHGSIGRSTNPHRLFAMAQTVLALFGIVILGSGPKLLEAGGAAMLFALFAALTGFAALAAGMAFPRGEAAVPGAAQVVHGRIPTKAWLGMVGISSVCLAQAMIFSFVERIGSEHGFSSDAIAAVLITVGLVNLLPGPLAALLQRRLRAERVVLIGPLVHAAAALLITHRADYLLYGASAAMFVATVVFLHTFLFGLLARLDPSGRAVSATPAMLMIGSCSGPVIAGTVVGQFGYGALGVTVAAVGAFAALLFAGLQGSDKPAPASAPAVQP